MKTRRNTLKVLRTWDHYHGFSKKKCSCSERSYLGTPFP